MEDRFNVVNDLEHTGTSIYGIFDGHGGEVGGVLRLSFSFRHVSCDCLDRYEESHGFLFIKALDHRYKVVD